MGVRAAPRSLPLAGRMLRPTVPLPGKWTFWADTMVGNVSLGNVDVSSFYCVRRLSAFGHGNVTVNLPCGLEPDRIRMLWTWRLWAFYDGEPFWCGVPTGLSDQDGSAHAQLTLIELPGYLTRRAWDHYPNRVYRQVEQTAIARDIAQPAEDVGVRIVTEPGPGFPRDRTYEYLEGGSRGQLLANLAGVLSGPEFRTEYRMLGTGRPECVLRIAYPRVGSDAPGLGMTIPGAALGYRAQWDSDQLRTRTFAVGDMPSDAAEGTPRPVAIEDRPQAGVPRLDHVDDWPGTVLSSTLRERARTMAETQARPALGMTGSPPEEFPPISVYGPGDTVTVRASTPLIPGGLTYSGRLAQIEVNAAEGVATWALSAESPAPVTRELVTDRLNRIDGTVAEMFHSGDLRDITLPPLPVPADQGVTGWARTGDWRTLAPGTSWWRISDFAPMRANAPAGAAVVIEASGLVSWYQQDLEFGLSWTGGPQTATAKVEGKTLPFTSLGMAVRATVTAIVISPGQLRAHLSVTIAPRFGNMSGGTPADLPFNMLVLEGHAPSVAFTSGSQVQFNLVARFGDLATGQSVQMEITKATYYGGAQPDAGAEEER